MSVAIPDNIIVLPNLDLAGGESLEIALSNLTQLEQQFSKICSNLDQRLANIKGKLGNINQRIGTSRQKVETLKDINEAITIVSPSKFVRVYKKGEIVYHQAINSEYVNNRKIPPFNYENNVNLNTNIRPNSTQNPNSSPSGLLQQSTPAGNHSNGHHHHHDDELRKIVKQTRGMFNTKRELFSGSLSVQNQRFYGLGRIPRDIKYIDSLVVFNSKHNPYQKYITIDNTASNNQLNIQKKAKLKDKDKINLHEAPTTLKEGDMLTQFGTEDHRFRPEAKALPQLVAPTQLGLKGIVNINLGNYEIDHMTPSKGGTVNRPTVPDPKFGEQKASDPLMDPSMLSMQRFSNVASNNDPNANANQNMQSSYSNTAPTQSSSNTSYGFAPTISQNRQVNVQAPQVSAPQPTMTTSTYSSQPRPNVSSQPQNNQPAPVAQQPNNANPAPAGNTAQPQPATNKPAPAAPAKSSGRAALLDEIRNPKIKLKKAEPAAEEKPALERKGGSKPAPALNHLDHLKQQIQLRFQALNKNKKDESSDEDDDD